MLQPAFGRDRVEAFAYGRHSSDAHDVVLPADLAVDHGGGGEEADAALSENLDERAVVDFTHDRGPNFHRLEPALQPSPQWSVLAWQHERRTVEGTGEAPPQTLREAWTREYADVALAEYVVEGADLRARVER